jgi:predicted aldo/keto reductase-like oxidoreductase
MQYRSFSKLDWRLSALGFGAMRLPTIDGDPGQIDEPEATQMVRYAIDHGVNYVDSAYGYHRGASEAFLGRALQGGYRERVRVATKMPCWLIRQAGDFDRYLDEQLERLQDTRIDFYLLHSLGEEHWPTVRDLQVFDWAERAMADGRIDRLGFSFHGPLSLFQEIIDYYGDWTVAQIQYNFMDEDYQAGTQGLKYAADRGLAVVIMEPIRGGMLSRMPPQPIIDLWSEAQVRRSPAEWALRWVWNHPEVSVVLSGMSTMEHVVENIATAETAQPGTLTSEELALIGRVRDLYRRLAPIPCTQCEYCLPCPNGVNIPRIFQLYNEALMYNDLRTSRMLYGWLGEGERAGACAACGDCEALCPQSIEIIEWLAKSHELLAEKA